MFDLSKDEKVDRAGVVYMNYKDMLDKLKELMPSFTADLFDRIEQKGLFVKRESSQKGGQISFFRSEFAMMVRNWKILKEVEKWNDKGFVEIVETPEKVPGAPQAAGAKTCPSCSAPAGEAQKFCGECGHNFSVTGVKKAA